MSITTKKVVLLVLMLICLLLLIIQYKNPVVPVSTENEKKLDKLPEQETVKEQDKKEYRVYYLTIEEIEDGRYHGTTKEGTGISFQPENLKEPLPEKLAEGDIIKVYFDLQYSANGLVKVEKVKEIPEEEEGKSS